MPKVTIRALWGNDDAESTIRIPIRVWEMIQEGEEIRKRAWAFYEGRRFSVGWRFKGGEVFIAADDMECFQGPIEELYVD
jgi:hypothetical protein